MPRCSDCMRRMVSMVFARRRQYPFIFATWNCSISFAPSFRRHYKYCKTFATFFWSTDSGTLIIRSGPQFCRICRRSCAKLSNERFNDAGNSSDPIKLGPGVWDRCGELRVLADFVFHLRFVNHVLFVNQFHILWCRKQFWRDKTRFGVGDNTGELRMPANFVFFYIIDHIRFFDVSHCPWIGSYRNG